MVKDAQVSVLHHLDGQIKLTSPELTLEDKRALMELSVRLGFGQDDTCKTAAMICKNGLVLGFVKYINWGKADLVEKVKFGQTMDQRMAPIMKKLGSSSTNPVSKELIDAMIQDVARSFASARAQILLTQPFIRTNDSTKMPPIYTLDVLVPAKLSIPKTEDGKDLL